MLDIPNFELRRPTQHAVDDSLHLSLVLLQHHPLLQKICPVPLYRHPMSLKVVESSKFDLSSPPRKLSSLHYSGRFCPTDQEDPLRETTSIAKTSSTKRLTILLLHEHSTTTSIVSVLMLRHYFEDTHVTNQTWCSINVEQSLLNHACNRPWPWPAAPYIVVLCF